MLNDIYQGLDPIAFSLGPLVVRWYGLAYVLGFVCAAAIIYFVAKRWKLGMSEDNLLTLMVCAIVGVVLGARIGYVLFYGDGYYLSHPLEILAFNQGGMSFHGGLVGLLIGGAVAARMTRIPFLTLADLGSIAAPIGLFFGRCANFVNGELYGAPTDLPIGVDFTGTGVMYHPSQLYEALLEQRDAVEDDTAVHLELRLTRSAQTHRTLAATRARAAALAFEVSPQTLQTRKHIAILRQLHLCLCRSRLRAHGEDVEDERCAVEDFHLQHFLYVAHLLCREFVIEDDHADGAFSVLLSLYVFAYLLQLTRTHVRHRAWSAHALCEAFYGYGTCGVGKELQLVEIFFCLCLVLFLGYKTYEYGCLSLYF